MRRDLAVCRAAKQTSRLASQTIEPDTKKGVKLEENGVTDSHLDSDVPMSGLGDSPKTMKESPQQETTTAGLTSDASGPVPESQQGDGPSEPRQPLQLEIPTGEHSASDNPADAQTGTYSNFDFESLFNDPSAATSPVAQPSESTQQASTLEPSKPVSPTKDQSANETQPKKPDPDPEPNVSAPESDSFDFTISQLDGAANHDEKPNTNNEDNDDSNNFPLLPGLETYANAPGDEQESGSGLADPTSHPADTLNIFNAAGGPDFGGGATLPNHKGTDDGNDDSKTKDGGNDATQTSQPQDQTAVGDAGAGEGEMKDDPFDAMIYFEQFDMGNFSAEDGDGDHTIDASFFDI